MWPSVTSMIIMAGWVCVFPAAESADPVYKKVGDEIVLKPDSAYVSSTGITWKHGSNIAMEWDGDTIEAYRQFKARGSLNISTGEMTIRGLTPDDGGSYTAEINDNLNPSQTQIIVIFPVPTPTVLKTCDAEVTSCTLTCDGNTTGAQPVTYNWKLKDKTLTEASKEHIIKKESSSGINEFSCELENPVSRESSQPIPNPFTTSAPDDPVDTEAGNLKISTGLTVFITLLAAVLLMGLIHRWKAGMWFYEKESMPWEADFWKKHERPRVEAAEGVEAAESNGTTAHQEKEHVDEETPMT